MSLEVTAKVGTQSSERILLWGNHQPALGEKRKFKRLSRYSGGKFNRWAPWESGRIWKLGYDGFVFIGYE